MLETGRITEDQFAAALDQGLWWSGFGAPPRPMTVLYPPPRSQNDRYPYVVDYIRRYLEERYGRRHAAPRRPPGRTPPSTRACRRRPRHAVAHTLRGTTPPLEMSLVSLEPATGMVKALVGGRDFNDSQVNLALAGFPPGSSFKAFTSPPRSSRASRRRPASTRPRRWCGPGCRGGCEVGNAVRGESGYRDMFAATGMSINTWFVLLIERIGVDKVVDLADRRRCAVPHRRPDYGFNYQLTLGKNEVSPAGDGRRATACSPTGACGPSPTPVARGARRRRRACSRTTPSRTASRS